MITSFRHKGLRQLFVTGKSAKVRTDLTRKVLHRLDALNAADKPDDMNVPGFYFHGLQGTQKRYSVRVSANYRITFGWDSGAIDVDLEDYH